MSALIYGYNSKDKTAIFCKDGKKIIIPYDDFERMVKTIRQLAKEKTES